MEWKTKAHRVAKITFPRQTPDRGSKCEALVFNPWNAHEDNRPLGNFNRARKVIYKTAEAFRK